MLRLVNQDFKWIIRAKGVFYTGRYLAQYHMLSRTPKSQSLPLNVWQLVWVPLFKSQFYQRDVVQPLVFRECSIKNKTMPSPGHMSASCSCKVTMYRGNTKFVLHQLHEIWVHTTPNSNMGSCFLPMQHLLFLLSVWIWIIWSPHWHLWLLCIAACQALSGMVRYQLPAFVCRLSLFSFIFCLS